MSRHPETLPSLVFADAGGNIYDLPDLKMAGRSGRLFHPLEPKDLIPMPEGSELFVLPQRIPVGWDPRAGEMVALDIDPYTGKEGVQAVAAFISPAHTQTAMAAFQRKARDLAPLPLFAYTAVGWWKGRFWVSAFRSDPDPRQDFRTFDQEKVRRMTTQALNRYRRNRLIQHLGKCSLTYGCPAARNLFLGRWEAPLPTSPRCNARCLGCLSLQEPGGPPATQDRITFVPRVQEVVEVAVGHIGRVSRPVVSFGQGCEGEPLLQAELLRESVAMIKKETFKGTVNLNTNASRPGEVERLAGAGLDSMRISMNSIRQDYYERYYRPKGYGYQHVIESWRAMKRQGRFVSLNLFVFPGLTDEEAEIDRLCGLAEEIGLDLIQLRNHNIDPDWYLDEIDYSYTGSRTGVRHMARLLKKRIPGLRIGYFNPYLG